MRSCRLWTTAFVAEGDDAQMGAVPFAGQLPRNDVAVVLHGGDDHLVAFADVTLRERGGYQIDAFRRATGEDDFVGLAGVDESLHGLAGVFIGFGGLGGQIMGATVYVAVERCVVAAQCVDDRLGLLCGGCVVEINQRLVVDGLVQQRKL